MRVHDAVDVDGGADSRMGEIVLGQAADRLGRHVRDLGRPLGRVGPHVIDQMRKGGADALAHAPAGAVGAGLDSRGDVLTGHGGLEAIEVVVGHRPLAAQIPD
jgi:hypothetical protein